jgi:hypothetical protein
MTATLDPWVDDPAKVKLPRVGLLLVARPGVTKDAFAEALVRFRDRATKRMPEGSLVRVGIRHSDDPLGSGVDDWDAMASPDASVEISWPAGTADPDFTAPVRGLVDDFDGLLDPDRCVAFAGTCHLLETGDGPVMMSGGARRVAGTTLEELSDWWLHHHGPLCMQVLEPRPLGYQQLHPDRAASRDVATAAGIATTELDMFVTSYFASVDDFLGPLARPGIAELLRTDEEGHYDHSTMFGSLFQVL